MLCCSEVADDESERNDHHASRCLTVDGNIALLGPPHSRTFAFDACFSRPRSASHGDTSVLATIHSQFTSVPVSKFLSGENAVVLVYGQSRTEKLQTVFVGSAPNSSRGQFSRPDGEIDAEVKEQDQRWRRQMNGNNAAENAEEQPLIWHIVSQIADGLSKPTASRSETNPSDTRRTRTFQRAEFAAFSLAEGGSGAASIISDLVLAADGEAPEPMVMKPGDSPQTALSRIAWLPLSTECTEAVAAVKRVFE